MLCSECCVCAKERLFFPFEIVVFRASRVFTLLALLGVLSPVVTADTPHFTSPYFRECFTSGDAALEWSGTYDLFFHAEALSSGTMMLSYAPHGDSRVVLEDVVIPGFSQPVTLSSPLLSTSLAYGSVIGTVNVTVPGLDSLSFSGRLGPECTWEGEVSFTLPSGESYYATWHAPEVSADADNDGVADSVDACPDTPPNTPVDSQGCPVVTDLFWSANDGDFSDADNWEPAQVPTVDDTLTFDRLIPYGVNFGTAEANRLIFESGAVSLSGTQLNVVGGSVSNDLPSVAVGNSSTGPAEIIVLTQLLDS